METILEEARKKVAEIMIWLLVCYFGSAESGKYYNLLKWAAKHNVAEDMKRHETKKDNKGTGEQSIWMSNMRERQQKICFVSKVCRG